MYCKVVSIEKEIMKRAEKFFGVDFCNLLQHKENYAGSIIARYLIAQYMIEKTGVCSGQFRDDFTIDGWFFAISHTKDFVGVIVSNERVGIDIAEIMPRHDSLLKKYIQEIILLQQRNIWYGFYEQRVAKETLLKYLSLSFNHIDMVRVVAKEDLSHQPHIDEISQNPTGFYEGNIAMIFAQKITVYYEKREYDVLIGKNTDTLGKKHIVYGIIGKNLL